jgi:general secretion pathway protein H
MLPRITGRVPARAAGFTLMEMLVVLVILGLMLGLVLTRGPMRSRRLDLDAAARTLADSLRLARAQAIARNQVVSVPVGPGAVWPAGIAAPRLPADIAVAGSGAIVFAPDGSSSGGTVTLATEGRRVQVEVNWLTGRVAVGSVGPAAQP